MPLRRRLSPAPRELTIGLDSLWASHLALTMWTWAANRLQKTFFSQGPAQSSVQVLHRGAERAGPGLQTSSGIAKIR